MKFQTGKGCESLASMRARARTGKRDKCGGVKKPQRQYLVLNLLAATSPAKSVGDADRRIERMLDRHARQGFRLVGIAFGNKAIMESFL